MEQWVWVGYMKGRSGGIIRTLLEQCSTGFSTNLTITMNILFSSLHLTLLSLAHFPYALFNTKHS
jgi:hypothetical protein